MEMILFVGIQASGKSTFYRERFLDTHIRINLDMLRTRHRERILIDACLTAKQPFVVDNTNPTKDERGDYIRRAKEHGFHVAGYYFASQVEACKQRNELRGSERAVPLVGLLGTYKRLELPDRTEGFQELYHVSFGADGSFCVSEWNDEV
jgi:predicted kinase